MLLTAFGGALLAGACPNERPDPAACAEACEVAAACGVLPSILGGVPGDNVDTLVAECTLRCINSDTKDSVDAGTVQAIFSCLEGHDDQGICGVQRCVDTVGCLRTALPPSALGQPEVTFQLLDGEYWTLLFEPQLCDVIPPGVVSIQPDDVATLCARDGDPCPSDPAATPYLRPPLCVGAGCLDVTSCDPRLCGNSLSAAYECAFMGIETVQFGWLDEREVLHLDPSIYNCDEASAGQIVPGIGNEVIYPVAIFNGTLPTRVLDIIGAPHSAEGNAYCWFSHPVFPPEVGWLVRSGPNVIAVPAPGSARIAASIGDDPNTFPRGCGCLLDGVGCEDIQVNANCENEIDDDLDGLVDAEDPGCAP